MHSQIISHISQIIMEYNMIFLCLFVCVHVYALLDFSFDGFAAVHGRCLMLLAFDFALLMYWCVKNGKRLECDVSDNNIQFAKCITHARTHQPYISVYSTISFKIGNGKGNEKKSAINWTVSADVCNAVFFSSFIQSQCVRHCNIFSVFFLCACVYFLCYVYSLPFLYFYVGLEIGMTLNNLCPKKIQENENN